MLVTSAAQATGIVVGDGHERRAIGWVIGISSADAAPFWWTIGRERGAFSSRMGTPADRLRRQGACHGRHSVREQDGPDPRSGTSWTSSMG